jgi:hypothetical protein
MQGSATRKCKETLLQVRQRLVREQTNRTDERITQLLENREEDLDSDSEEELDNFPEESQDLCQR